MNKTKATVYPLLVAETVANGSIVFIPLKWSCFLSVSSHHMIYILSLTHPTAGLLLFFSKFFINNILLLKTPGKQPPRSRDGKMDLHKFAPSKYVGNI